MEHINGFYYRYKNIRKLEIRIFYNDLITESKINDLINKYGLKKLKTKDYQYFNEKLLKVVYNESIKIDDFITDLESLKILKVKYVNEWKNESIQTL